MATCPTSLYRRTSHVVRAASFHSTLARNIARDAERAVRSGNCAAGRKMLLAAMRIVRRDVKLKKHGLGAMPSWWPFKSKKKQLDRDPRRMAQTIMFIPGAKGMSSRGELVTMRGARRKRRRR